MIAMGGPLLFVVGLASDGECTLVGHYYIHGIMDGELIYQKDGERR